MFVAVVHWRTHCFVLLLSHLKFFSSKFLLPLWWPLLVWISASLSLDFITTFNRTPTRRSFPYTFTNTHFFLSSQILVSLPSLFLLYLLSSISFVHSFYPPLLSLWAHNLYIVTQAYHVNLSLSLLHKLHWNCRPFSELRVRQVSEQSFYHCSLTSLEPSH